MIFNVTGGGGNAGLNFSVVSYETQEEMLSATPAENTIGIITETPITNWFFSSTQPSIVDGGTVWIHIGTSSNVEFNALTQDILQVYPIGAKQYIGGEWVNKTAQSYQGGVWVEWHAYVYRYGDKQTSFTGGWTSGTGGWGTMKVSFTTEGIALTPSNGIGAAYTKNKINVDNFSKLCAELTVNSVGSTNQLIRVGIHTKNGPTNYSDWVAVHNDITVGKRNIEVDLSTITGEYYVGVMAQHMDMIVNNIYLI